MNKLRLILSLAIVAFVGLGAFAAPKFRTPVDGRGNPIAHPLYGGYTFARITNSSENLVCSKKCLLAGLIRSTGPEQHYILIRDTGTADGGGTQALPLITFQTSDSNPYVNPIAFPVIFTNGISVEMDRRSGAALTTDVEFTVLYIDLDD